MNKWQIICPLSAIVLAMIVAGVVHERRERRGFTIIAMESIGQDLITTTNSPHLAGIDAETDASLSALLRSRVSVASVIIGDERRPTGAGKACSVLVLTNDLGEGLAIRIGPDEKSWFYRMLSCRKLTEPSGAANRSHPIRNQTNQTSVVAGSAR